MAAAATLKRKPIEEAERRPPIGVATRLPFSTPRARDPGRSGILSVGSKSSGVVEITSSTFAPSQAVAEEIAASGSKGLEVRVIAKGLTQEGVITVRRDSKNRFDSTRDGSMPLLNPWTQKLGGMHLNFAIVNSVIKDGHAAFKPNGGSKNEWWQTLRKNSALLGGAGLKIRTLPKPVNIYDGAKLVMGVTGAEVLVGGYVDAKFDLLLENMATPTVSGSAAIRIGGTAGGEVQFSTAGEQLQGSATLTVTLPSFNGSVNVVYKPDGTVDISGKAAYNANKLSGEIQFVATDEVAANKFARDAIAAAGGKENVQNAAAPAPVPAPKEGQKKRALAATGKLNFNLTTWFAGTVSVVVDGKGAITVIGKIAPPGEIQLFKEREWKETLVAFEAKAYYGIPVVGNLNLFANISLIAIARLGPAKLYAIEIIGTYSTDPEIQRSIQISGSINISAYGGLRLRAEGGAGIEILGHDLKFGIGLNADVGVKAYADARPTIGYRDPGIFYVSGTLDLVAQPVLGLSGEFFIELDAPWISPLDDDRWTWPLFSKEWPLGDPIGISASVKDYVLGSGTVPDIKLSKPEFDPSKFMTNMVDDKLPNKSGGKGAGQGTFKEDGSVPKPVVPPKKPAPKAVATKPAKKGTKLANSKSRAPDAKAANDAKITAVFEKARKPLEALKGKGAMTRGDLDRELARIKSRASRIDFDVKAAGANWSVLPSSGRKTARGIEVGMKRGSAAHTAASQDPMERVRVGAAAGAAIANRYAGHKIRQSVLNPLLTPIRDRYALKSLIAVPHGRRWRIVATINPETWLDSNAEIEASPSGTHEAIIQQLLGRRNQGGSEIEIRPNGFYGAAIQATLSKIHRQLLSADAAERRDAINKARLDDKVWTVLQGMIYAPFAVSQQGSIANLRAEVDEGSIVYSLERGGSRLAEQVAEGTDSTVISIEKRKISQRQSDGSVRQVTSKSRQVAALKARIMADLASDPGQRRTIILTETMVGGGSTDQMIAMVNSLERSKAYPNVRWKILILQQTAHTDDAKGIVEIRQQKIGRPNKVKLIVASTPYILGEDVGYQSNRAHEKSKSPVILFKATGDNMHAYQIVPMGETMAADIILDLVSGKYNGRLANVL